MFKKIHSVVVILLILLISWMCGLVDQHFNNSELSEVYVFAKDGLRLRFLANTEGGVIITIPYGSKVEVLETEEPMVEINGKFGKWKKVKFNNQIGWAFGGYLSDKRPPDRPVEDLSTEELFNSFSSYRLNKDMGIISNRECCPNAFGCKSCSIKSIDFRKNYINIVLDVITLSDDDPSEPEKEVMHCYVGKKLLMKYYGKKELVSNHLDEQCIVCATEGHYVFPPKVSQLSLCK